jgi:hypothetical protein
LPSHPSLVAHIKELVKLAFMNDASELSSKAFALLENANPTIVRAMVESGSFESTAHCVISLGQTARLHISRLALVTLSVLSVDSGLIGSCCGFIFQLLSFAYDTTVLSLFEFLCRNNPELRLVQEWLMAHGFVDILLREVDSIEDAIGGDVTDFNANRLVADLSLVRFCAANPMFRDSVCSHRVISLLNRSVGEKPRFVEDARWRALEAVYCAATVEMMRGLFQAAIELMLDRDACRTQSGFSAVVVLRRMLEMDQLLRPFIIEVNVPKTVVTLMVQNPDHSILHHACRSSLVAVIGNRQARNRAIADCIPIVIQAATSDNRNLVASMFELVRELNRLNIAKREMKAVPGFAELLTETKKNTTLMNGPYGGPVR